MSGRRDDTEPTGRSRHDELRRLAEHAGSSPWVGEGAVERLRQFQNAAGPDVLLALLDELAAAEDRAAEWEGRYAIEFMRAERDEARAAEDRRKIEAYDAARATVKIEGNTRAYYVLRAVAAEDRASELEREQAIIERVSQRNADAHMDAERRARAGRARADRLTQALAHLLDDLPVVRNTSDYRRVTSVREARAALAALPDGTLNEDI